MPGSIPYKELVAILTQSSTNAPVLSKVFTNEIGTLTLARAAEGIYTLTGNSGFLKQSRVVVIATPNAAASDSAEDASIIRAGCSADGVITIKQYDADGAALEGIAGLNLVIRVYDKQLS